MATAGQLGEVGRLDLCRWLHLEQCEQTRSCSSASHFLAGAAHSFCLRWSNACGSCSCPGFQHLYFSLPTSSTGQPSP